MARKPDRTRTHLGTYLAAGGLREHGLPSQAALGFHRGRTEELLKHART